MAEGEQRALAEPVGGHRRGQVAEHGGAEGVLAHARDSNRAVLPGAVVERGRKMDMSALVARDAREKRKEGERAGGATVTVAFESVRGRYFGRSFTVWR